MRRLALIGIVSLILSSATWAPAAIRAQDEDELEDAVAELTELVEALEEDIDDLRDDVEELDDLREEVDALRDEVASLEQHIADLEAGTEGGDGTHDDGTDGDEPDAESLAQIVGTWVETVSTAESVCGAFVCARKSEWMDLELGADGRYSWGEAPYEAGTYEVYERYGEGEVTNLDVVLVGDGDQRCEGYYDFIRDTISISIAWCPGLLVENPEGGDPLELNGGFIAFAPGRGDERDCDPTDPENPCL